MGGAETVGAIAVADGTTGRIEAARRLLSGLREQTKLSPGPRQPHVLSDGTTCCPRRCGPVVLPRTSIGV